MFLHTGSIDDDIVTCTADVNRVMERLQASLSENINVDNKGLMRFHQLFFHAQVRKDTQEVKEMVEHMQTFIIGADKQEGRFPRNAEEGYNAMKEMQLVLARSSKHAMS